MQLIVQPSEEELLQRNLSQQNLDLILKLYQEQGFVTIAGVLSMDTVRAALQEFAAQLDVFRAKNCPSWGPVDSCCP